MIDNLILNAALDVVWYATSLRLKVGQEYFHTFFTLLMPFGIPAYRYYFQTTSPQYNFTPEHWATYTLAYCVLLLATRDAVEYLTLGHPFLDHTLTVCRITLAVFWFSMFRNHEDDRRRSGSILGGEWLQSLWAFDDMNPREMLRDIVLHMHYDLWLAAQYAKECPQVIYAVVNTIAQYIYSSLRTAWRQVPDEWFYLIVGLAIGTPIHQWTDAEAGSLNRWLAHHFSSSWVTRDHIALFVIFLIVIVGNILFAYIKRRISSFSIARVDVPLVGLTTFANTIYRQMLMAINNLTYSRVPRALSRLLLISLVAGVGYLRYTYASSSSSNLSSSGPFGVSPNSQFNVLEFEQVKTPHHVLVNAKPTPLHGALHVNPISHVCPSTKHDPKYTAAVMTASAKERVPVIEVYEHKEIMRETIAVKVCYIKDGEELPCPDDGFYKFGTISDIGAKGVPTSVVESATRMTVDVLSKGMSKIAG